MTHTFRWQMAVGRWQIASRTAAVLCVVVTTACEKPAPPVRPPVSVVVATSERGQAPYVISANGVVEPAQSVDVQSQVGGVLTAVHFREGDEVKAGQLLFEIDPRPYEAALRQAEAVLARDQATADNARRDADRFATLAQKDFVTKSQADQALSNAEALKAALESDKAVVANARFNLENASIKAPVTGKTGSLLVRLGNLVKPAAPPPLVVINQIHPILVRFAVNDRDLPLVHQYSRKGTLRALAIPTQGDSTPVAGRLTFIDNGVDTTTGTLTLKAQFENRDNRLWPGQFVRVGLELFVENNALLVPSEAVMTGQDGQFVYVVNDSSTVAMHPVKVSRAVGRFVLIESGLEAGSRVVVDGQSKLAPGSKVEVKEGAPVSAQRRATP